MSQIIRRMEERDLGHIVEVDNQYYYVDSTETIDLGYETMVFECDERGEVENWANSLYVEWHINEESMVDRHNYICEHLEEYL